MDGFSASWDGDTLRVSGELDLASADDLEATFLEHLDGQGSVTIDLSDLAFIDSSGIRTLIRIADAAGRRTVVLRSPQEGVRKVLDLTLLEGSLPNVVVS